MNGARDKLDRWLEGNPDSWLTQSYASIGEEVGISATSVDRYLPELIADRDGIMPSAVLQQREEAGLSFPGRSKPNLNKVREVIKANPGAHIRDVAYLAKCHPKTAQRIRDEIKQELEESQNTGNEGKIQGINAEIAELQARRKALSKS